MLFLIKLTICWGFFALFYTLMLRYETFFRANRIFLLLSALVGLLLAALSYEVELSVGIPDEQVIMLPMMTIGAQLDNAEGLTGLTWKNLFLAVYLTGVLAGIIRLIGSLRSIIMLAVRGHFEKGQFGTYMVFSNEINGPFSFFNWVFIPLGADGRPVDADQAILQHEMAHARGWHTLDVLLMELLCIAFWFHPLAHWYKKEVRTLHEFLADAEASSHTDKKQYGLLLIRHVQSGMPVAIANHFFQSPLKQRLIMLMKQNSAPVRGLKFALSLPMFFLFMLLFRQAPAIAQKIDGDHLKRVQALEANKWIAVDTVVTFDPKTLKEDIKIVSNDLSPQKNDKGQLIYQLCEQMPEYPGGTAELYKFLAQNIQYPAVKEGETSEGKIYVKFTVMTDGTLSGVQVNEYSDDQLPIQFSEESLRVVKKMPKWKPAMHKGKKVNCRMNLPIMFKKS